MMRLAAAVLCFTALPLQAVSCELTDLVFLQADDAVHYEFTQHKTVAALSRPLQSSGVLGLSADQQLVWQTLTPLKSTLVISASGLKQFDRNDALVNELDLPVAQALAQVFLGVLSGNTATLEAAFTQTLSCEDEAWQLELTPTAAEFAQLLTSITVSGAAEIERLAFREARGDYTEIQLSAPQPQALDQLGLYLGD